MVDKDKANHTYLLCDGATLSLGSEKAQNSVYSHPSYPNRSQSQLPLPIAIVTQTNPFPERKFPLTHVLTFSLSLSLTHTLPFSTSSLLRERCVNGAMTFSHLPSIGKQMRRVFVRSMGSDCDPIRTVIQSNWLILFFSGTGSRSDSNPIMIRSYPQ